MEESIAQFEFDLDLDMIREQAKVLLDFTPEMQTQNGETTKMSFPNSSSSATKPLIIVNNKVEEKDEQVKPLLTPILSNDKEVGTETHSFITIPLETIHETQASVLQCLEEPSQAKRFKDLCTHHKSRNCVPQKILQSTQLGYLRWQNIDPSKGLSSVKEKMVEEIGWTLK